MMSEPRKLYQKIYSQRALESCNYAMDSDKKQFLSNYTTLPQEKSDTILSSINQLIQQTLNKTTYQLQESVYMTSKIAGQILKSECLDKLKNINTIKGVLFQLIILIKQQSLSNQKNFDTNSQIKNEYLIMKSAFNEFKNHVKSTKILLNQASQLFNEILYQNNQVFYQNRNKRLRTQNMQRQFEALKNKISDFSSTQKMSVSIQKQKDSIIQQCEFNLVQKDYEITRLKKQSKLEKEKYEIKLQNLNNQLDDKNHEIQMLRDRISTLIMNKSVILEDSDSIDSKNIASSQSSQTYLNLLLIQCLTIQNML